MVGLKNGQMRKKKTLPKMVYSRDIAGNAEEEEEEEEEATAPTSQMGEAQRGGGLDMSSSKELFLLCRALAVHTAYL